ncbi:Mitogen-activated protein kinase kinase kinase NPK1 [Camellia lanceoleosa]|uniref:Mitogen-activated protein kinase kinase kinase NPK1 n=1 Tax=Camellia lanceoleosa TaxID=1840588 RepID=A0ACC0ILA6_9ERIC|nr:Mitogen-activated protein kinase kinase kinase NPK1 [Camellia lanceoleosa]
MQDFISSVCQSLVFKPSDDGGVFGGFVEKIGSIILKSGIGFFSKPPVLALPPIAKSDAINVKKDDASMIRWRKGELIGCGAFGRVYIGLNIDSRALLAIKQVSIAANTASKEKTQAHIRELEEEVNLLENLSHPNIVRYLGTTREEASLNILLEIVPGGSISSLLGKFGSFPESVIRMSTKQLLLGVEYLHRNGIMHRDIKGANILVGNKGCIKLADFSASKKVVELATMIVAKLMKGTPYWMAPEAILQTEHSFSADIWSVGCTVIEMATGKPPWICFILLSFYGRESNLRLVASNLLQVLLHYREYQETYPVLRSSVMETCGKKMATPEMETTYMRLKDVCNSVKCSTIYLEKFPGSVPYWGSGNCDDDTCQIDDEDDLVIGVSTKFDFALLSDDFDESFNPMLELDDNWPCKSDDTPELESRVNLFSGQTINKATDIPRASGKGNNDFTFPCGPLVVEDDDDDDEWDDSTAVNVAYTASSGTYSQYVSNIGTESVQTLLQVQPSKPSEWKKVVRDDQELINPSAGFYERKRIWEEELYKELERK